MENVDVPAGDTCSCPATESSCGSGSSSGGVRCTGGGDFKISIVEKDQPLWKFLLLIQSLAALLERALDAAALPGEDRPLLSATQLAEAGESWKEAVALEELLDLCGDPR